MKLVSLCVIAIVSCLFYSCSCSKCDSSVPVVSQQYVHKYGFDVSPDEWVQRASEGKIISMLENGVKATESFENGILHGMASYTFPYSDIVEKVKVYDQGILLKEVLQDRKGVPIQEEMYEFDNRKILTLWDHNGAPLSVEEYNGESLVEGTYYNSVGDIESTVQEGTGTRIKRDRLGKLLIKDQMEGGILSCRTTYHPNNQVEMISHYDNYTLHGEQTVFTPSGKLHIKAGWDHGKLHGLKIVYKEGVPYLETSYRCGKKNGPERQYDEDGSLISEVFYWEDLKHGTSTNINGYKVQQDWFYYGKPVSAQQYKFMEEQSKSLVEFKKAS